MHYVPHIKIELPKHLRDKCPAVQLGQEQVFFLEKKLHQCYFILHAINVAPRQKNTLTWGPLSKFVIVVSFRPSMISLAVNKPQLHRFSNANYFNTTWKCICNTIKMSEESFWLSQALAWLTFCLRIRTSWRRLENVFEKSKLIQYNVSVAWQKKRKFFDFAS